MSISLKPKHLKLYADLGKLFVRYGRADLLEGDGSGRGLLAGDTSPLEETAFDGPTEERGEALARDLEAMGPTFIKVGQLLSTRPDLLPVEYLVALSRLQDRVEPFDSAEAEEILVDELGVRISKAFSRFDSEPIASASLGQVHYAEMRDGRPAAVKIQRPGARTQVISDLQAMEDIAEVMARRTELGERFDLVAMVDEFRVSLMDELDYRQEARNLQRLQDNLERFDRLLVPSPVMDFTTSRVLVMEWVDGMKVTELSPLARMEMDGQELAKQLFEAYLQQVLVDGFFHADPHPGNLSVTPDHRIVLLDLGKVARIASGLQEKLVRFLMAVSEGDGEAAAEAAIKLGVPGPRFDELGFVSAVTELVDRQQDVLAKDIELGRIVLAVTRAASEFGVRIPGDLSMLGKTLLNLDRVGRVLDPEFDPNAAIRTQVADILRQRMWKKVSPGRIAASLLELNDFTQELPGRLNRTLDLLAGNQIRLEVDAFDERLLMEGLQKIANRITLGLVMAALIVGAAMLMQVETEFTLLGYPGLAMILFIGAVVGGVGLVVNIVRTDERADHGL
jgi:predicted unusual protein kinase regulating ubiquinone biosynthesis (AarF/ABC1/UbiB family)